MAVYRTLTHWNWLSGYSSWKGCNDVIVPSHHASSIRQRKRSPAETNGFTSPLTAYTTNKTTMLAICSQGGGNYDMVTC